MKISAKVILDSQGPDTRLITMELIYPRIILAEVNTHRCLARNTSSSRAVPVRKLVEQVWRDGFVPSDVRQNQSGMQGYKQAQHGLAARLLWRGMTAAACATALAMSRLGVHKQHANRWLEPAMWVKTVATSTKQGWDSLLVQRDHAAAQPEFQSLAKAIRWAIDMSEAQPCKDESWHVPYLGVVECPSNDELLASVGRCAGVSYYRTDAMSRDDAIRVARCMLASDPQHLSPFEHVSNADCLEAERRIFYGWETLRKRIEEERWFVSG